MPVVQKCLTPGPRAPNVCVAQRECSQQGPGVGLLPLITGPAQSKHSPKPSAHGPFKALPQFKVETPMAPLSRGAYGRLHLGKNPTGRRDARYPFLADNLEERAGVEVSFPYGSMLWYTQSLLA